MASGTRGALRDSGSAVTADTSQLQRAGWQEAAADSMCPICLDNMDNAAYIDICFHAFCFECIRQWAASRADCPLCRQPFNRILHTVRADDDYQEYVAGSPARRQRTVARQRVRSRSPERRYPQGPRPNNNNNEPIAGRRGPAWRHPAARGGTAPRSSSVSAREAAGERLVSPHSGPHLYLGLVMVRAWLIGFNSFY